jgi:hypothetical protein
VGRKSLQIVVQTRALNRRWVTIPGSAVSAGPVNHNPVRGIAGRPAYLGHVYRAVARARLLVPNGHAGCSLTSTCLQAISLRAVSRGLAP